MDVTAAAGRSWRVPNGSLPNCCHEPAPRNNPGAGTQQALRSLGRGEKRARARGDARVIRRSRPGQLQQLALDLPPVDVQERFRVRDRNLSSHGRASTELIVGRDITGDSDR
jgi:hypothetical protein